MIILSIGDLWTEVSVKSQSLIPSHGVKAFRVSKGVISTLKWTLGRPQAVGAGTGDGTSVSVLVMLNSQDTSDVVCDGSGISRETSNGISVISY